jgi:hypothetical protein
MSSTATTSSRRSRGHEVDVTSRVSQERKSAGDPIASNCEVIEVHVSELRQLFNAIDPSPFREKDLDADAENFIVGWAREVSRDAPLALLVYLDRPAGVADEPAILRDAVREYFGHRAQTSRQRLRQLFRVGRTSLVIGLGFLGTSRKPAHRRVGRHVAADGDLSIRLVADPCGSEALRSSERDACAHCLHNRRQLRSVAVGLARVAKSRPESGHRTATAGAGRREQRRELSAAADTHSCGDAI